MIFYFGKPWARVAEEWEAIETPVGKPCAWCDEIIVEGDQGICSSNYVPHHRWCWFRRIFGGVNHQLGKCDCCCGGTEPPDPPNLTLRQAAEEAVRVYVLRQGDASNN